MFVGNCPSFSFALKTIMHKNLLFYIAVIAIFGTGVFLILEFGTRRLEADRVAMNEAVEPQKAIVNSTPTARPKVSAGGIGTGLHENLRHPLSILLLQVIVILITTKIVGAFLRKAGQPTVVGEMIAGILLGPSLLGLMFPETMSFLFPPQSLEPLRLLSQIGIVIFMFIVGIELNVDHLRERAHAAVLVSHASIIVPFFLGAALSLLLYRSFAPPQISFSAFALFISVAMSITAFPVLARIIEERGLSKSHLGSTAIACSAVDDVTAWCLLAVVVAIVKANGLSSSALTIFLALLFIGVMLFMLKPRAERIIGKDVIDDARVKQLMALVLAFVFASALFTEVIGIHALFGAFLAGVMVPRHENLRLLITRRLEAFTTSFLLPLFFAFTGLRTQIGLLDDWFSWLVCAGVIVVAIAGKLGGSIAASRWTGMSWHDSLTLGLLMNTRGLIELIVLNIGYDLGILSPRIFSMLVLMALTTTFMTGPLLSLLDNWKRREAVITEGAGITV